SKYARRNEFDDSHYLCVRVRMTPNTASANSSALPMMINITAAPRGSMNCPMSHGKIMPPKLAPTKNQPVTAPVMTMCRPANVINVGNADAMPSPNKIAPPHNANGDTANSSMTPNPASAKSKSTSTI